MENSCMAEIKRQPTVVSRDKATILRPLRTDTDTSDQDS